MAEQYYVRQLFKVREQGRDIYVQTSEWFVPRINPETGLQEITLESHPEWNTEPLKAGDYAAMIERRPLDAA